MKKTYWTWTCSRCGFDDNRNTDEKCRSCSCPITCSQAGGHHATIEAGKTSAPCVRGCGYIFRR